jgi:hypothetical protein
MSNDRHPSSTFIRGNKESQRGWFATTKQAFETILLHARNVRSTEDERL